MKIIIGGAGRIGFKLARFLASSQNDVVIIDNNQDVINRVNDELDATGIYGIVSDPEAQNKADAKNANVIICITPDDEKNMVGCQVAHSLFNVPHKIARIGNPVFHDSEWSNLFSRNHMPIDYIVFPEEIIANALCEQLSYDNIKNIFNIVDENLTLITLVIESTFPLNNTMVSQVPLTFSETSLSVISIVRDGQLFFASGEDQIYEGDEVTFLCPSDQTNKVLLLLGFKEKKSENHIVIGGGHIGQRIVDKLRQTSPSCRISILEQDEKLAEYLSRKYEDVLVFKGFGLNHDLIDEANQPNNDRCNIIVATNNDETNILVPLINQEDISKHVVTLVSRDRYHNILSKYPRISTVSPKELVVQEIINNIHRLGNIRPAYTDSHNSWDIYIITISKKSGYNGILFTEFFDAKDIKICGVLRNGSLISSITNIESQLDDKIIIACNRERRAYIENRFSSHFELI